MVANSKKDINQINLDNHRSLILIPLWWLWAAPGLHTITSSTLSLFNEHISTKGVISFTECRKEGIWDRWDRRAEIPRELILVNVMQNGPLYIKGALYVSHKELTHQKRPWCWGRLKAGGQGEDRKWDGWMASPTRWTWICASSRNWWWSGKPGVLQSMGSQRVGHNWVTELNWCAPKEIWHLSSSSVKWSLKCHLWQESSWRPWKYREKKMWLKMELHSGHGQ